MVISFFGECTISDGMSACTMINMMEVGKPSGCPVKAVKFKKKGKASR